MAGGRPLKFENPQQLWEKAQVYFLECIDSHRPITITGLALALDTTRQTLMDYQEKDEYFDTITRAKLIVENYAEERIFGNNPTGAIFALKNYGWRDKQETEHSGNMQVHWPLGKSKLDE